MALTALLDDPSPLVRKAMAEAFASAPDAPPAIVVALASDQSEIAAPILGRSPVLTDGDLIDCAAIGDAFAQAAIALRAPLSVGVSAAIAEVGAREALIALAVNPEAAIPISLAARDRMVERFGHDGEVREALLSRPALAPSVRADLVSATAAALSDFVIGCAWLSPERAERVEREASEKGACGDRRRRRARPQLARRARACRASA